MTDERIHRAVSADGTEIAGRVRGRGAGAGPGPRRDRGRRDRLGGPAAPPHRPVHLLPAEHPRPRAVEPTTRTTRPPRLEEDVTAFVDSIGEPVCLVGWSGSGAWVLGAAARSASVAAVAAYEPGVVSLMGEDDLGRTFAIMEQVGTAAADGRLVDAVRAFAPWICTDEEIAALEETDFYERWAGCVPAMLRFVQQDASYQGPRSTDPEVLGDGLPRRSCSCVAGRPCSAPGSPTRHGTSPSTSPTRTSASCRASVTSPRCSHPSPSPRS